MPYHPTSRLWVLWGDQHRRAVMLKPGPIRRDE